MLLDTWLIFRHQLRFALGNRIGMAFGMLQPILYLTLFGPLLAGYVGRDAWRVFVPGTLMQLSLMSAGMAGFGIVFDARFGVLERLRVTPASRLALLLGRVLTNTVVLFMQAVVLVVAGFAFGLRVPFAGLAIGLALIVPLAVGLAALSYAFALVIKRQELFAPMTGTIIVPLLLLSGSLLPMATAPRWLDLTSRLTPFRYVVEALRAAFAGDYASRGLLVGTAVSLVFVVVAVVVATRTFIRANA